MPCSCAIISDPRLRRSLCGSIRHIRPMNPPLAKRSIHFLLALRYDPFLLHSQYPTLPIGLGAYLPLLLLQPPPSNSVHAFCFQSQPLPVLQFQILCHRENHPTTVFSPIYRQGRANLRALALLLCCLAFTPNQAVTRKDCSRVHRVFVYLSRVPSFFIKP